ncbi:uroporphyrinogen-III synthase [Halobacillus litoralis]|uniref:uroporphyrinogen-III synthase n=1 Tax=Halobacillus litoralis TaxID=45668 RepID=UPI0024935380|nr:uroporphyrinogen-III synthase [Halobacillus litoralis]
MNALQGKSILITREKSQAEPFTELIEGHGGVVYQAPLLTFQLNDSGSNRQILYHLHDYSWVFLTSSNGVKFFFELLSNSDVAVPAHLRFAIIGEKTEQMLIQHGHRADFMPDRFNASSMVSQFFERYPRPGKLLYIRGSRSRDVIPGAFKEKGVFFQSITVYDTLLVKDEHEQVKGWLEKDILDALTFTSPSTIHAYMSIVRNIELNGLDLPCFCIGPTTAETARRYGFKHVFTPELYTVDSMFAQLVHYFSYEGER